MSFCFRLFFDFGENQRITDSFIKKENKVNEKAKKGEKHKNVLHVFISIQANPAKNSNQKCYKIAENKDLQPFALVNINARMPVF
jgi:hypothetical protein